MSAVGILWENEAEDYIDKETVSIGIEKDYLCNVVGNGKDMVWESQQAYEDGEGVVNRPNEEQDFSGVCLLGQLHYTSSGDKV